MPGLAHDERVGLGRLHAVAERAPEAVVDLVRNIETPSIDIGLPDPLLADADQIFAQLGVRCVELGMAARAVRERLVIHCVEVDRKALDAEEPVAVLTGLALFADVLEREPPIARVIEDAVQ